MHQAPHLLPHAGLDDALGKPDVGRQEAFARSPDSDRAGTMHHRLDILAEAQDQRRVGEVAGNELGAPRHQMFHRVRTTTADPYRQALLQGEASETPADEARRPRYQNPHCVSPVVLLVPRL